MQNQTRITVDPNVMGGKPCIRGMRVTVGTILDLVAEGYSTNEILAAYPYLEENDISEAQTWAKEKFLIAMAKVANVEPPNERNRL